MERNCSKILGEKGEKAFEIMVNKWSALKRKDEKEEGGGGDGRVLWGSGRELGDRCVSSVDMDEQ